MILYLDTSALVKLFVEEKHSRRVRQAVAEARLITTHAIAYVEACAAFARLSSDRAKDALLPALRQRLDSQWETWEVIQVTEHLIRRAADLAGRHRLRGYDSVHLAAAESAFEVFRDQVPFRVAVFDEQLAAAATRAGMPLITA